MEYRHKRSPAPTLFHSDFRLFHKLMEQLCGGHFYSDDDVMAAVKYSLSQQDAKLYRDGITKLLERWQKCLDSSAD